MKVYELIIELQSHNQQLDVMVPQLNGDFTTDVGVSMDTTDGETVLIVEGTI